MRKKERGLRGSKCNVVVVCGVKNSGKTTLVEKLTERLTHSGKRVAVIKHDGHDFTCDIPGTDSDRFWSAGAYGTAVYSQNQSFVHKRQCEETEKELIEQFPEADIIFIEGRKDSTYPKIEVIREEISSAPVSNPEGRFLIVTDRRAQEFQEETAGFHEIDKVIAAIENICGLF